MINLKLSRLKATANVEPVSHAPGRLGVNSWLDYPTDWQGSNSRTWTLNDYFNTRFPDSERKKGGEKNEKYRTDFLLN